MPWTFFNSSGEALIQDGAMTIANNTNNRVVTATGADPASLNGEANLTFDGTDLTVGTGNVIIGTAGKGIDFSNQASPAGGMTSELLDRYEEGTFSPLLYDQAGNAAPSMGATVGRYTRIGNRVHFHFQIQADDITGMTTSSQVVVRGLPFTSVNVTNTEHVIGFGHGDGFAITAGVYVNGLIGVNSTYIYMLQWSATTGTGDFTIAHLSADGKLKADGVYEVAT